MWLIMDGWDVFTLMFKAAMVTSVRDSRCLWIQYVTIQECFFPARVTFAKPLNCKLNMTTNQNNSDVELVIAVSADGARHQ